MGRFYQFPNVTQISDLILFVCSIVIILWYDQINNGVPVVEGVNQVQFELILLQNFTTTVHFKFQYVFSAMILCLFMKISPVIEFNQAIGPLLKIVQKMASDFMNFILIYLILVIMFSIIGNLNFHFEIPEFSTFFDSLMRLAALPGDTRVCCAHEYTQDNLRFAYSVEPDNAALAQRIRDTWAVRADGGCVVPSTVETVSVSVI